MAGDDPDIYVVHPRYTIMLLVKDRMIVDAPPIARWTIGRTRRDVLRYFAGQYRCTYQLIPK